MSHKPIASIGNPAINVAGHLLPWTNRFYRFILGVFGVGLTRRAVFESLLDNLVNILEPNIV